MNWIGGIAAVLLFWLLGTAIVAAAIYWGSWIFIVLIALAITGAVFAAGASE